MDRILLVVAIVFLYSSPSLAAHQDRTSEGIQYTLVSYHETGFAEAKPIVWMGKYGQLSNENAAIGETSFDTWLDRKSGSPETGIGVGVVPLFDTYGVFRTSSDNDSSTYVVLGFIADELAMDEAGALDSRDDSKFSYGFGSYGIGVNDSTSKFEYMMSMDQGNYEISAIGMSFISEF